MGKLIKHTGWDTKTTAAKHATIGPISATNIKQSKVPKKRKRRTWYNNSYSIYKSAKSRKSLTSVNWMHVWKCTRYTPGSTY